MISYFKKWWKQYPAEEITCLKLSGWPSTTQAKSVQDGQE